MKAFVLAAGFGTRLRPLTVSIPKPLIPVLNIPSLCYTLFLLKEAGIRDIVCNLHYHADAIVRYLEEQDFFGMNIMISEEKEILGTGGGLKKCESLLKDDDFVLINSDIITDISLDALIKAYRRSDASGVLMLHETPQAGAIGHIGVQNGMVKDFRNMRRTELRSDLIYTGTAVLSPDIFNHLQTGFSSIVDTGFTGLIDNGGVASYVHDGLWQDIGTLEEYLYSSTHKNRPVLELGNRMQNALGIRPHMLADDARISPEATVTSSVIGKGCQVGPGAIIENALLLPGVSIDERQIVSNSIVYTEGIITLNQVITENPGS
ncbi:MAG: NDP-sugar synthase [Prosthecochloris sp.]|uniref:Nucleotidyl transferase n=1 Tax=Prosthecochloris aestuarii (strain DSM 271 / SK 413) TaxID=290512 RepID=B4S3U5_PROA2|nr:MULTISPECIES: NDP-sugar synthase [Prosthecochloris]ACF45291.1 Nucleotidyl transferase [Prosthecochloris aestuarii DSM 271]MCW8797774.1 NDP-sugar synthase [Prosthecochloris sp.]